jgi:hypothetical protein
MLGAALRSVDSLLNVHWGEWLLDRLAERWQSKLTHLDEALAELELERQDLQAQTEALSIHAAVIYLGGRVLARNELRFDPADPHDEQLLDASIDLLVKSRLASIEPEEIEPGRYVYHLEPDWQALRSLLADTTVQAPPHMADWFREGLELIDEAFLSQVANKPHAGV